MPINAKLRRIIAIIAVIAALSLQASYSQDFFTAKEFEDKCFNEGAANLVDGLTREWENPVWDNILENIASGDEDWIRTLNCLKNTPAYSNAMVSIDIDIMLATALPKNPKAVLELGLSGVATARACSLPFIEPERAWAAQYVKDTLAALEAIPDDATMWNIPLAIERDVCIMRLKDAYAKKYDYAD